MIDGPSKIYFLPSLFLTVLTFYLGIHALPQAMCSRGGWAQPQAWVLMGLSQSRGAHSHDWQYWFRCVTVIRFWLMWCDGKSLRGLLRIVSSPLKTHECGWSPFLFWDAANFGYNTWSCCCHPVTRGEQTWGQSHSVEDGEQEDGKNLDARWCHWGTTLADYKTTLAFDIFLWEIIHFLELDYAKLSWVFSYR